MKILTDDQMPERQRNISKLAKDMAIQMQPQIYNVLAEQLNNHFAPFTAQEQMIGIGNFLNIFNCYWIVAIKKICESDDNDISMEELIKNILNGIAASFGGELEYTETELPHGIKRLNK